MKVLKFGGTSVGTPDSILTVKNIALSQKEAAVIVVSAFGGVTDDLVKASSLASEGDDGYKDICSRLRARHLDSCDAVIEDLPLRDSVKASVCSLCDRLEGICSGVSMLQVLPAKTAAEIVSFGERLSSAIVAAAIPGAEVYDSLGFIKTCRRRRSEGSEVDMDSTLALVRSRFEGYPSLSRLAVVPGFISSDIASGEITNLGRGGSDYTASLLAAALNASVLEIWTDVDGFMTADPKIIRTSYVIDEMSYEEAMELCNFGAKVVYPPTLYPACQKGIPIIIRNTFNPSAPGTVIRRSCRPGTRAIKGISSIDDVSLITLSATSMMGIVGVDSRLFAALAEEGISAFLVSQSASETSISVGVGRKDAERAEEVLDRAFEPEIRSGAIDPVKVENELAAVAVIGESMKHHAGTAGKLFTTLGRNGISVIAMAQGASKSNISFIVERRHLRKSLNVIHDSFFLSENREVNLFVCGVGTVGGQLIDQIAGQRERLISERNLKINIVGIARSTKAIFDRGGLELSGYRDALEHGENMTPELLVRRMEEMNIFNSVFVDCTASPAIAALYGELFEHGISVVAANKIAASGDFAEYRDLKDSALKHGVRFLFETNVGAGLPIISTINDLRMSGDRIIGLEAVLSGTLNFIFNTISADIPFSRTVRMAQEMGFSEPDPRIDLSGKDVIRKLVILSREAGYEISADDVRAELFIPADFFDCSLEEFWRRLPSLDEDFERRRLCLEAEHKRWRFVARMSEGRCSVALDTVCGGHSFYELDGSNNIILLTTERYNRHPMLIQGYGAGASVTAAGVFADIIKIANI